jgi:hypothetical protein
MKPRPGCVDTPLGIVSWWPAEDEAWDVVGRNHMGGFFAGTPHYTDGKVGRAFLFDGTESMTLNGSAQDMPSGAADRTVELWARADGPAAAGEKESYFFANGISYPFPEGSSYKLGRNE